MFVHSVNKAADVILTAAARMVGLYIAGRITFLKEDSQVHYMIQMHNAPGLMFVFLSLLYWLVII